MKEALEGTYSFDSSILLEMLAGTSAGQTITNLLAEGKLDAYTSYVNLAEAEYVICRKIGHDLAKSKIENFIDSNFVDLIRTEELLHVASRIKCERSIALADCFCIAVAEVTSSKALFAFKEKEIARELHKRPFKVKIGFLDEVL